MHEESATKNLDNRFTKQDIEKLTQLYAILLRIDQKNKTKKEKLKRETQKS